MTSSLRRKVVLGMLLSCSLLNLSYIATFFLEEKRNPFPNSESNVYSYDAHDFPATLPLLLHDDLPSVRMTDEETLRYPLLGKMSDPEWFSLAGLEEGSGYLRLGPQNRIFAISMFHQMHCLRMLNLAFTKARIATPGHIHHCLNYLRQGALCTADLSLEPGNFEDRDFRYHRTGATHTCRDWSIVYPIMQSNYVWWSNLTGSDERLTDGLSPIT